MRRKARPRVGLVLGAGGVLGAAWMAGALPALQERLQRPIGGVDLIMGTSAGSVLAAALRCGVGADEIVAHQRGVGPAALPHLRELDRDGGPLPRLPRMRIGSPRLLASAALAPHRIHPWVAASALVLEGRGQLHTLSALVEGMLTLDRPDDPAAWPGQGETWIMAVDYDSGRRVAFGRAGAPPAGLPEAVVASCSIPGWYAPKVVAGRRYVDAGVRSATSLDLLARVPLDEVYVLAPMASFHLDRPTNPAAHLERVLRRLITALLIAEVRKVRAAGTKVTVLAPGPADLAAIGPNLMDPARRLKVLETSRQTSPAALGAALRRTAGPLAA
jgi:NTE family protein